jgi:hypothetical protein
VHGLVTVYTLPSRTSAGPTHYTLCAGHNNLSHKQRQSRSITRRTVPPRHQNYVTQFLNYTAFQASVETQIRSRAWRSFRKTPTPSVEDWNRFIYTNFVWQTNFSSAGFWCVDRSIGHLGNPGYSVVVFTFWCSSCCKVLLRHSWVSCMRDLLIKYLLWSGVRLVHVDVVIP